jgi:hypothetical protein
LIAFWGFRVIVIPVISAGGFTDKSMVPLNLSMFVTLMIEIWNEPGVRVNVVGVADKRKPREVPDVACAVIGKVTESTSIDVRISTEVEVGTVGFAHRDSDRIRKPLLPTYLPLNLHSIDDRTW